MFYRFWKKSLKILCSIIVTYILTLPAAGFAEEYLIIAGTGSALASINILGQAFEKSHPGIKVKILPSFGSTGGIKAVAKNAIHIGLSSKVLNDKERRLGLFVIEYAKSPLIFVVNRNVPISNITSDDIVKIYNGDKTIWPDGQRIRLPLRQKNETDVMLVKMISPQISKALDAAMSRPGMMTVLTDQDNADMIEKVPGGFGVCTLTQVISEKRCLKILSYNGVIPNIENLVSGSYPLSKSFSTVTQKNMSEPVRRFLAFMRSSHGKKILEESGLLFSIKFAE